VRGYQTQEIGANTAGLAHAWREARRENYHSRKKQGEVNEDGKSCSCLLAKALKSGDKGRGLGSRGGKEVHRTHCDCREQAASCALGRGEAKAEKGELAPIWWGGGGGPSAIGLSSIEAWAVVG